MKRCILCVLLMFLVFMNTSYGAEDETIEDIQDEIDRIQGEQDDVIEYQVIQDVLDEQMGGEAIDFRSLVSQALKGDFKSEGESIWKLLLETLFADLSANMGVLLRILVICLIAALYKVIAESFENKQVVEVGNFVVFLILMASIIASYHYINTLANDMIDKILAFIEALVPSILAVTVLSGATLSSVAYSEGVVMLIGFINQIIKSMLLPFLYVILIFAVLNALTEEDGLKRAIELMKKGYEWALKIIMWVFIAIFGLQSFGLPVMDGLISRTAKQTLGIVPVVGSSISQLSDLVVGCGTLIKNAFGVGAIIAIILLVIGPVVKIGIISLIYKISAAITEPISDSRIVSCLSNVGDVCFLLLGTLLLVVVLFIATIAITLYLTNMLMYIR